MLISYEQIIGVMNRGVYISQKVINRLCITIHTSKGVDSWKPRAGIE